MAEHEPKNTSWMQERNTYARSLYGQADAYAREVEKVYRGEFEITNELEDSDIQITRPAKAYNLVQKHLQMLAIRSRQNIQVDLHDRTKSEQSRVDKLEEALQALLAQHRRETQRNVLRDAAYWALLRGRGAFLTTYEPRKKGLKIRIATPDPYTYFPVYDDGVEWFTREYYRPRIVLQDYFAKLGQDEKLAFPVPDLKTSGDDLAPSDLVHVIEYWDEIWYAWVIDGEFSGPKKHSYGFCPLAEFRVNETPEEEQRWAFAGLLAPVLEDLKHHATLMSKAATAFELFYYPMILYETAEGAPMVYSTRDLPDRPASVRPGTKLMVLNPTADHNSLQLLLSMFEGEISKATLSEISTPTALPGGNVSGFAVSQVLSLLKDALSEKQAAIESGYGQALSNILRLMEQFADLQPGGAWQLPLGDKNGKHRRRALQSIRADDIDGHYGVTAKIAAALPQDKLQMVTIFNQLYTPDPTTGKMKVPYETALALSGLDAEIKDVAAMRNARDWEWVLTHDPKLQALQVESIKSRNARRIREMRRAAERRKRSEKQREERVAEKEIEDGAASPLIVPEEQKHNPAIYQRMAALVAQGQNPELALSDLPLGIPGQPQAVSQAGAEAVEKVMEMLEGAGGEVQQPPDGLRGYEGINPAQLPPAMQGARPRQSVDQDQLFLEQVDRDQRRGALPPPK